MKTISFKRIFIATLIVSVFSAAAAVEASELDQAPAGVVNYTINDESFYLVADSSEQQVTTDGELTQITLTETFSNQTEQMIIAEYQPALPNPAALVNYEVTVDSDLGCEPASADNLVIVPGQSVTVTVTYNLVETQLVSFHSTLPTLYAEEVVAPQVASSY
ncbi:hypothetical protein [Kangiella aquimarina]|uniref:Uncharacterized protein n=1 Tax=Kangiella aquimarina TaxID=261965 RepID=A0ABZ0X4T5_9GAMM|nr:hypothetical protein [Kangiella aquimarina]WQG85379.1 hypothetical protein SR900_00515 [Kangiella aquimarina]